jgi:hypothetical protein
MFSLLQPVLRWLAQKLVTLLAIIAVLLLGMWLHSEWMRIQGLKEQASTIEDGIQEKESRLRHLQNALAEWSAQVRELSQQLASLEQVAITLEHQRDSIQAELDSLKKQAGFFRKMFDPKFMALIKLREEQLAAAEASAATARRSADRFRATSHPPDEAASDEALKQLEREIADDRERQTSLVETASASLIEKTLAAVRSVLVPALWILLGVVLAPLFIKAFLYFCVAPMAAWLKPVRILPATQVTPPRAGPSGVSLPLEIEPGMELLIHPDFLQSSGKPAHKRTRWFLNARLPFSSALSGMIMLTAIRPAGDKPTRAVVSPTHDALGEVGIIELPPGASMVIHPRALAGVLQPAGHSMRVTRHWRLFYLHSWLTFQFRYLVFHGPGQVILKGCRGVKAESPDPDSPRLLNQAATLGFSSHLDYANTRCETFVSYLRGKEELFNDLFGGDSGLFVYEEMPAGSRRAGLTGRGLEGLLDGFLKAFGI